MIGELTVALTSAADAIDGRDPELAGQALRRIRTQQPIDDFRDALRTAREVLIISPLHRRQRHLLRSYLDAAEPLDHALRNCRVLLRRTRSALVDGEPVPPSLAAGLRKLAAATELLAANLGRSTGTTREALRGAARSVDNDSLAHSGFSAQVVAAQLRSVAVDLLQATGLRHDEARANLPTISGPEPDQASAFISGLFRIRVPGSAPRASASIARPTTSVVVMWLPATRRSTGYSTDVTR